MNVSAILRIYRIITVVLVVALGLMPLIYRHHIVFATSATAVVTFVLMLMAFRVQRLRLLASTIAKLDELLELLRDTSASFRRLSRGSSIKNSRYFEPVYCERVR